MPLYVLFAIVVCSVLIAGFARRRGWNAPLIVLAAALAISWIPGVGHIEVEPEILLGVILPPLLYSAALSSSYQDFRAAIKPILNLGVGHVLVTAFAVAGVVCLIMGEVPFAAAMVLGAVVAPPDAVAAAAVAKKLGLPRRITNVLTGESLINDATSLTLYKVALAGVFATGASFMNAASTFALAVVGGVGVGLALGLLVHIVRRMLDDPVVETVLGLIVPFVAYWLAEVIHGSGVLAVVAAGFLIGRLSPRESYSTRLYEEPLWAAIDLILESFTFAFIGLQLPSVWSDIVAARDHTVQAIWVSLAVLGVVLVVRPMYVFATRGLWTVKKTTPQGITKVRLSAKDLGIVSWAGMRGVVTLAAAAAIPVTIHGAPFPQRATLQLAAYTVAIGTLLLQGLSLPTIIRRSGIDNSAEAVDDAREEARARRLTAEVAAETVRGAAQRLSEKFGDSAAQGAIDQVIATMARRGQAAAILMSSPDHSEDGAEDVVSGAATPVGGAATPLGGAGHEQSQFESDAVAPSQIGPSATEPPHLAGPELAEPAQLNAEQAVEADAGRDADADADAETASPMTIEAAPGEPPTGRPGAAIAQPSDHPVLDVGHTLYESEARAVRGLIDDIDKRLRAVQESSGNGLPPEAAEAIEAKLRERQNRWREVLQRDQADRQSSGRMRGWRRFLHSKPDKAQFKEFQRQLITLRRQIVRAQRNVIVQERNAGRLSETVMRTMMRELDLEEETLATSWATRL